MTVDEIAAAADVGRMTVFNHFPRKEDMFFDRDEEVREILREALRQRDPSVAPIETLRLLAHRLVAEQSPFSIFLPQVKLRRDGRGQRNPQGPGQGDPGRTRASRNGGVIRMRRARPCRSRRPSCGRSAPGDVDRGLHPGSPDLSTDSRCRESESRLSRYC